MRIFAYGFKEVVATAVLSSFIGGGFGAMIASTAAKGQRTSQVFVNRINKGDRLPVVSLSKARANSSPPAAQPASIKRVPFGCDPMFSSVADPTRAHFYNRCAA